MPNAPTPCPSRRQDDDPIPSSIAPPRPREEIESYLTRTDAVILNSKIYGRRFLRWCFRNPRTEIAARVGWGMDEAGNVHRVEKLIRPIW